MVNLCSKLEQDRSICSWLSYWRLTTDFSSVLRDAPILPAIIWKTRGPISTKLGGDIVEQVIATHAVQNGQDILLSLESTAAQSRALVSDKAKNRTFRPLQYYGRGMGDLQVVDSSCTYVQTSGIRLMGGLAAAAVRRVLEKKKERKNSAVKLKASA